MRQQRRDATRITTHLNKKRAPRSLTEVVEEMRGHALFYMHKDEHGPDSAIGIWLWNMATTIESDSLLFDSEEKIVPAQRKSKEVSTDEPQYSDQH